MRRNEAQQIILRPDLQAIFLLIPPGSKVLDLGCGHGDLLAKLIEEKNVTGQGVEIDSRCIYACVSKGVPVIQADLDDGQLNFPDQSYDFIVLNQTLPWLHQTDGLLQEVLRVGTRGVVSLSNYAHWRLRINLLLHGRLPAADDPHATGEKYFKPHPMTLNEWKNLADKLNIRIFERQLFNRHWKKIRPWSLLPSVRAYHAIFTIGRRVA